MICLSIMPQNNLKIRKSYLTDKHNQISKGFVCIWGIKLENLKVRFIVPKLLKKLKNKWHVNLKQSFKISFEQLYIVYNAIVKTHCILLYIKIPPNWVQVKHMLNLSGMWKQKKNIWQWQNCFGLKKSPELGFFCSILCNRVRHLC